MFGKSGKVKKLRKERMQLIGQYEDLFEKSSCAKCDSYNNGNVELHEDRFKNCKNCEKENELVKIAKRIDELTKDIDSMK